MASRRPTHRTGKPTPPWKPSRRIQSTPSSCHAGFASCRRMNVVLDWDASLASVRQGPPTHQRFHSLAHCVVHAPYLDAAGCLPLPHTSPVYFQLITRPPHPVLVDTGQAFSQDAKRVASKLSLGAFEKIYTSPKQADRLLQNLIIPGQARVKCMCGSVGVCSGGAKPSRGPPAWHWQSTGPFESAKRTT